MAAVVTPTSASAATSASASASSSSATTSAASSTTSSSSHFYLLPTGPLVTTTDDGSGGELLPTSSHFIILPEPTISGKPESHGSKPDIYYLVLLGILVVLIVFAALLTMRGHRMRRRYRTATQLAIARGEPVSWWRDGPDAADILGIHAVFRNGPPPPGPPEEWANVGSRKKARRWVRIPILWDAEVTEPDHAEIEGLLKSRSEGEISEKRGQDDVEGDWDDMQPLTVHSLLPDATPLPPPNPVPPPPVSVLGLLRYGLSSSPAPPPPPPPPPAQKHEREVDRVPQLAADEPLRVAFMIQMPILPEDAERERMRRERERDDDEDEAGWRAGMEIGVWEGSVADGIAYPPPPGPPPGSAPSAPSSSWTQRTPTPGTPTPRTPGTPRTPY